MKKNKRRHIITFVSILLLIGAGVLTFIATDYYRDRRQNFMSNDSEEHAYYINNPISPDSLYQLLAADYTIASQWFYRRHVSKALFTEAQIGYYRLPKSFGDALLIRRLMRGEETPIHLSFTNQIRDRQQLASRMGKVLRLDSIDVICRLDSLEYLRQYGLNRETAICLFIPNTYEVYWTITPDQLFARMKREYDHFWSDERRQQASAIGLTPTEVSTLASIVEGETHNRAEHPTIAGLYLNRLRIGMHLQACPTAIYASGNYGLRRVLKCHTQIDSPYNTYRYPGLPPGPIRCANAATMDSVLHAPKTSYLYMCANPDFSGTHIFSTNYSQHAAVAREYQRALIRRKIH